MMIVVQTSWHWKIFMSLQINKKFCHNICKHVVFLQYESADYALQFEIVTIYGRAIHVSLQFNIVKTFCHNICKHGLKTKEVCDVEAGKY